MILSKSSFVTIIILIFFIGFLSGIYHDQIFALFSNSMNMSKFSIEFWRYALPILSVVFSALIGYFFGTAKSFREQKQKAYGEILPPILKMAYDPNPSDEVEFSKGLSKLWLYGSKKVTKKMEDAVSILHHHERGDVTKAFQEAIVAMRNDIQIYPWQKITPKDVNHLYTKIAIK